MKNHLPITVDRLGYFARDLRNPVAQHCTTAWQRSFQCIPLTVVTNFMTDSYVRMCATNFMTNSYLRMRAHETMWLTTVLHNCCALCHSAFRSHLMQTKQQSPHTTQCHIANARVRLCACVRVCVCVCALVLSPPGS